MKYEMDMLDESVREEEISRRRESLRGSDSGYWREEIAERHSTVD